MATSNEVQKQSEFEQLIGSLESVVQHSSKNYLRLRRNREKLLGAEPKEENKDDQGATPIVHRFRILINQLDSINNKTSDELNAIEEVI